jgi:hypothetical protein
MVRVYTNIGGIYLAYVGTMIFDSFLHYKLINLPFEIKRYFIRNTFRLHSYLVLHLTFIP